MAEKDDDKPLINLRIKDVSLYGFATYESGVDPKTGEPYMRRSNVRFLKPRKIKDHPHG